MTLGVKLRDVNSVVLCQSKLMFRRTVAHVFVDAVENVPRILLRCYGKVHLIAIKVVTPYLTLSQSDKMDIAVLLV